MFQTFSLLIVLTVFSLTAQAKLKDINNQKAPFKLPKLPYAVDSLEPAIDKETMTIHHTKHHQAYINNINAELGKNRSTLIDLLKSVSKHSTKVRDNAGGHWNHSFFWTILSGDKNNHQINEKLQTEIETKFGSMDKFKEAFENAGKAQFGSGWVWLIRTHEGQLEIVSTTNQDNPIMDSVPKRGWPILGADVWEHAYYLKYKNDRGQYLKNFWDVVNWKKVSELDEEVAKLKL